MPSKWAVATDGLLEAANGRAQNWKIEHAVPPWTVPT
jgi:hypothetical protein